MIQISNATIGPNSRPFVIAEMSGNHNQSLDRAIRIVDAAVEAGASAIKLQTASPDGLTMDVDHPSFKIIDEHSPWNGKSLYSLYKDSVMPWEWHKPIFEHCQRRGIIAFSSPFESAAVDFLEDLDVPCYKIASFELLDTLLVRKVAETGKPLILSTGMATLTDIESAIKIVRSAGNNNIILLKCTSTYPANPSSSNIATLPHLRDAFGTQVGLSDHTMGVGVACAAVAMGATVIEKHFTLARSDGGVDATFSLEPHEFKLLVEEVRRAWESVGRVVYGGTDEEQASQQFRRSIYVSKDVKAGELLDQDNIRIIRPGYGLPPKFYEILLGRRFNKDLSRGTAISWDCIL